MAAIATTILGLFLVVCSIGLQAERLAIFLAALSFTLAAISSYIAMKNRYELNETIKMKSFCVLVFRFELQQVLELAALQVAANAQIEQPVIGEAEGCVIM